MSKLDTMSPWASAGVGFLLQPWALVAAGAASVAQADLSSAASIAYMVGFCVLSTASLVAMEAYIVFAPEAATEKLAALRDWLSRHRDPGIAVLALVAGIVLVAKGSYQLAT